MLTLRLQQVFNAYGDTDMALDVSIHFPMIKMILWFDIIKPEGSANGMTLCYALGLVCIRLQGRLSPIEVNKHTVMHY